MPRCTLPLSALCLVLCVAYALRADEVGHLVTEAELSDPTIMLLMSGDAVLSQTARLSLAPGANTISYAFGRLDVPLDRLQVELLSPAQGVSLSDMYIAPNSRDTAQWHLVSQAPCQAEIALTHPLKGIEWRVEYRAVINRNALTLDVAANLVLANRSKLDFPAATLQLPGGDQLAVRLKQNETFQVPLFVSHQIPYQAMFVYDPPRYGSGTMAVLRIMRESQDRFSAQPLIPGKLRMYAAAAPTTYVGEDSLPYLPPRESIDIKLGAVPEIAVTRAVTRSAQVDAKSDIRNRIVLFNQEDDVAFDILNQRKSPIVLRVRDKLSGDWIITQHSAPFEKLDAETIEFVVEMQPQEARRLTYTSLRRNLEP